ncbi:MAG: AMP-binding protein [Verrucomicrobiales bacterium]|nr:AMP-binding protein [Verrucomicrobiales bacterium]
MPVPRSRADLEAVQFERLRRLIEVVAASNPFYRERWRAAGLEAPMAVASLRDFAGRFPFTRKHDLVVDQQLHPPYGTDLTFPPERYTRCHGTSGSTGHPLRWLDTPDSWSGLLDQWDRVYDAAAIGPGDRVFFAFSFGPFLGFWTAFEAALRRGCMGLPGGGMTTVARLRSILDQQATVLCGTPTYALHLGEVARTEGLDLKASRVRRVVVAGEPGGSVPAMRAAIEAAWPGAQVVDHHGMTEVGPVSYGCPARPGILHVIEDAYLAEVIEPRSGAPVGDGELGELVLTTLNRVGSPLVRYRTGDLVHRVGGHAGWRCACGTVELALEGGVVGRVDDMVVIRGVNVFPSAVDEIIRGLGGVLEYRVEVRSTGALLELALEAEPAPGTEPGMELRLEDALRTRLGLRVPVRMVEPGSLPRPELKARRWVRTAEAESWRRTPAT